MVLGDVEAKEMLGREVLMAIRAAVAMIFGIVDLEVGEGGKGDGLVVGRKRTFHHCSRGRAIIGGSLDVLDGVGWGAVGVGRGGS